MENQFYWNFYVISRATQPRPTDIKYTPLKFPLNTVNKLLRVLEASPQSYKQY